MSTFITHIQCLNCNAHISPEIILRDTCPECGSPWLDARYDYAAVQARWQHAPDHDEPTLWRYADLLPVGMIDLDLPMGEGSTPFVRLKQYERKYQHSGAIYIKDERSQPTNSFKDRQAAVSVMAMVQAGVTECVLASTGNAAVAYAAYCARAGIKLWLFLTSLVPPEKVREAALYGCEVIKVSGTYDETKRVAAEFAKRKGIRFDKGAKSIPGKESMKTLAFEIAGQLAKRNASSQWQAPDWYVQAVSGGIGPIGVWKGFEELHRMGLIDKMPKLALVQATGCSPMVQAFVANKEQADPVVPNTLVHVLATGDPGKAYEILREACLSNGGTMIAVDDGDTFSTMREAANLAGLSVEPATAVAFAGLTKLLQAGTIAPDETVVLNCSGHTFPAESHILNSQYDRYLLDLQFDPERDLATDGLGAAIQQLDEQVTTIVVVDDSANDRRLIRRLLQTYKQYRIYEAQDGKDALRVIAERNPDLIVMDLMMPEMDGFQLLNALKDDPALAQIPVVVVTAKTLTPADKRHLDHSVAAIWQKAGIEPRRLVKDIVTALGHETLGVIQQPPEPQPVATTPAEKSKIVIVDDNPNDLRLARRIIQSGQTEYDITEARTGREALAQIQAVRPDLIILDMNLPDLSGIEVVETLQRDPQLQDIPIVIYSAHELSDDEQQRIQSSIRDVIRKAAVSRRQFLTIVEDKLAEL